MTYCMETQKGKEWLNSKDMNLVATEINGMSNNSNTKDSSIADMKKMANFLIDAGICKAGNKHTMHGVPFLVMIKDELDEDGKYHHPESDRFKMWVKKKYANVKDSANKRGISFDLTLDEMKQILKKTHCFYSGIAFDRGIHTLSIDRIHSNLGYTKDNVVACSQYVNHLKNVIMEHPELKDVLPPENLKQMLDKLGELV